MRAPELRGSGSGMEVAAGDRARSGWSRTNCLRATASPSQVHATYDASRRRSPLLYCSLSLADIVDTFAIARRWSATPP
ncbi:hypothetical protein GUJ93_ZPchr0009g100 [Zizania palustris]|uniref:Uncharacterized protein n=1 Tax=Zizania palustris TaxID=103762 RepID=A0A8J5R368_ZIZPA|nr:hypothetical protein GUJ93_ZPchr0009g100 [Zizania palustris]